MLKKSVIVAGRHYTSISVEPEFYEELQNIAIDKNISINQLVTQIDNIKDDANNLSSAVRVYVLNHLKEKLQKL